MKKDESLIKSAENFNWFGKFAIPELPPGFTTWPKITIVTPSFNQGPYIEETILSVLCQNYPNLEYFIVDGASTDETLSVIKKYENHLDWWVSEKDKGQTDAINKGFRRASGEYMNWLNSDDVLYPGALFTIALEFMKHPNAGFVYGCTEKFNSHGSMGLMQHPSDDLPMRYFYSFPYGQQACFYSRRLVEEAGYLNENLNFSMDYDLFIRLNLRTQAIRIDTVLGGFRDHETSKSNTLETVMVKENLGIFKKLLNAYDFEEGLEALQRCGAPELKLHGYDGPMVGLNFNKLPEITAKFLERYMFYFFDAKNYQYVYWAYRFIYKHFPELILSKQVYKSMYRKAFLFRLLFNFKIAKR